MLKINKALDFAMLEQLIKDALAFHSFTPSQTPSQINDRFFATNTQGYCEWPVFSSKRGFYLLIGVYFLTIALVALIDFSLKENIENFSILTPVAITLSTLLAVLRLEQQKNIASDKNGLEAINEIWKHSPWVNKIATSNTKISQKTDLDVLYESADLQAFYAFATVLKKILMLKKIEGTPFNSSLLFTVFSARTAFNAPGLDESMTTLFKSIKEPFDYKIEYKKVDSILNQAEKICQGIHYNLFDEELVKNYLGISLTNITTYLLPFIYAKREIHTIRMIQKSHLIDTLPFPCDGYTKNKTDLGYLYEYLEYYCYKWNWVSQYNGYKKAVTFECFHKRLKKGSQLMLDYLNQNDHHLQNLPLMKLSLRYSDWAFHCLKQEKII